LLVGAAPAAGANSVTSAIAVKIFSIAVLPMRPPP
jgi:hypothetical protein